LIREKLGIEASIQIESYPKDNDPHHGPGSGIVIWATSETGAVLGADSLGERGERAEEVGSRAAQRLVEEISTGKAIDSHLCDMLVPYLAVASGLSKIGVTEITSHLVTNIWVLEKILGTRIELEGSVGESGVLRVHGHELLS
jgi:RNA 3'-terminal phosphate cyclase